jgi:hypothetical protein
MHQDTKFHNFEYLRHVLTTFQLLMSCSQVGERDRVAKNRRDCSKGKRRLNTREGGVIGELCFWTRKEKTTQVGTATGQIQLRR